MKSIMLRIILGAIALSSALTTYGQTYAESAGVFSRITPGGSARIQALGGAQVALGGDYSSSGSNPAGLGMYNHSEFAFSPGFLGLKSNASYIGNSTSELTPKVNIPGFSMVFNNTRDCNSCKFLGGSIGISYNRIADFNQTYTYTGTNEESSILDYFVGNAQGFSMDNDLYDTPTQLAYDNYLILDSSDYVPSKPRPANTYYTPAFGYVDQHERVGTSGTINQWNISYGANINDRFFFGAGLGIPVLNFKSTKDYTETFPQDDYINSFTLHEDLTVKGQGFNLTLGGIVRPVNFLQIGLSYTTPTVYSVTDSYAADLGSSWKQNTPSNTYAETDIIKSDYTLVTPSKLSVGGALISKYGFITGDVEMTNYGGANYSSSNESYSGDNDQIKAMYRRGLNYRVGIEGRYSIFRLRAGYNTQTNQYQGAVYSYYKDNTTHSISAGVGVKLKKVSVDFALVRSTWSTAYHPYEIAPTVDVSNKMYRGIFTVAFPL